MEFRERLKSVERKVERAVIRPRMCMCIADYHGRNLGSGVQNYPISQGIWLDWKCSYWVEAQYLESGNKEQNYI